MFSFIRFFRRPVAMAILISEFITTDFIKEIHSVLL
jgi:hypothetical protein